MYKFVQEKKLDLDVFYKYIEVANTTNQFSNYGFAVKLLEQRARDKLKILDNKAVIAVNNGTSAIHAILLAIKANTGLHKVASQAFTFPSAIQGVVDYAEIVDFNEALEFNFDQLVNSQITVVTNVFGHIQNIDFITRKAIEHQQILIFDNAATPYSFWKGINTCNYGFASFISLHHTKPLGFGEGGLIIIDKLYESLIRKVICFGKEEDIVYSKYASNFKMSELSAAGILQWWDQIDFDELASTYRYNYFKQAEKLPKGIKLYPSSDNLSNFFPSCLPVIYKQPTYSNDPEIKKYYQPLADLPVSKDLYERTLCHPIT